MTERDREIEQLNFENWIEINLDLVRFIEEKAKAPTEIHSAKKFGTGIALTKKMNRGVEFGALRQPSKFGKYSLSARAKMYLDEHYGEPDDGRG